MAERSSIEWTDATFNPWIGCTKVSPACDNCYASIATPSRRFGVEWGTGKARRRTAPGNWALPLRWNAQPFVECPTCHWRGEARSMTWGHACPLPGCAGEPKPARRRVFCASLADVFDNEVDPQWRADLFKLVEATPNLDWLLLTKRIGNVRRMAPVSWIGGPIQHGPYPANIHGGWPRNVWLGATICNQAEADRDIWKLLAVPAAMRFLSMEPLLGRVDLSEKLRMWLNQTTGCFESVGTNFNPNGIGWVIVGGESGPAARPLHPYWALSLRDQCAAAGVPFLFKQWGEWVPALSGTWFDPMHDMPQFSARAAGKDTHDFGDGFGAVRIGKKASGRLLAGAEHNGYPEVRYTQGCTAEFWCADRARAL